jgi:hypothetical protein
MYLHPDALRLDGEVLEVLIQACYGVFLDGACLCPQFLGIPQGRHGGDAARYEVGDQELQGLLQRSILERLPGVCLKTCGTEMLGTAVRSCLVCCVWRHGATLRPVLAMCLARRQR